MTLRDRLLCVYVVFGKLYRLKEALQEQGEKQKMKNWENWTTRIKELMSDCDDKLADLKSKGEPEDGKDVEEQIILANVRFILRFVFPLQGTDFVCLCVCLFLLLEVISLG